MLRDHSRNKAGRLWAAALQRSARIGGLLGLMALVAGCGNGPRSILMPVSASAEISAWFFHMLLAVISVIMLIVAAWFIYSIVQFREKADDDGSLPPQIHGNTQIEMIWTIIPTLIIIAITIPTIQGIFELEKPPAEGEEVVLVDVTGKQWWWEYDYISTADPDKKQIMFSTANELHVPVGTTVHLRVTSADVIHAFWVPRVTGKRDATPGRSYPMYFKVDEPGEYVGQCAELCGASHALMGIKIFAHPTEGPNSYAAWAEAQAKPAAAPVSELAQKGKALFISKGCMRCHNIGGDARTELNPRARRRDTGPDLTHVGSRTTIGALALINTRENIQRWVHKPGEVKQGALMANPRFNPIKVSPDEAEALAAYLFRLK